MTSANNDQPKSGMYRSHQLVSFASVLLLVLMVASTFVALTHFSKGTVAQAAASFGFTYTGDYDQTAHTTTNLKYIAGSGVNFNLALGDLSYASTLTSTLADQWSAYAKSNLPVNFPFEIVDGRHDSAQIKTYEADLPDHIGGDITGTYGEQYYYDYPVVGAPLARFILISPNQTLTGANGQTYTYNYAKGSANYTWVSKTIDAARAANIPWVIVGMHQYCFVIGTASCNSHDLLDLLLNKHVDVILQAQKHNYQASKQLALNGTTCPTLNATSYNSSCAVNSTTNMTQGAGSVIVVTGTGGASQLAIDTTDPKLGYFRTWMPANNVTWGVSQFTITPTQLTEQFVRTSGGTFTDGFTISNDLVTPTVSASPSPSPTATVVTPLAQDTFAHPNQTLWGNASGGQTWGANANSSKIFSITNNTGQIAATSTNNYFATLGPPAVNAQVEFTGSISSFTSTNMAAIARYTDTNNWYEAYIDGSSLVIEKKVNGTMSRVSSTAFPAAINTSYTLLFSVSGSTLSASVWPASGSQPSSWMLSAADSSLSAVGNCGLHVGLQTGVTATFTLFHATAQ